MHMSVKMVTFCVLTLSACSIAALDFSSPLFRVAHSIDCVTKPTNLRLHSYIVLSRPVDSRVWLFWFDESFVCDNTTTVPLGRSCEVLSLDSRAIDFISDCFTTYGIPAIVSPCWQEKPVRTIHLCASATFSFCWRCASVWDLCFISFISLYPAVIQDLSSRRTLPFRTLTRA